MEVPRATAGARNAKRFWLRGGRCIVPLPQAWKVSLSKVFLSKVIDGPMVVHESVAAQAESLDRSSDDDPAADSTLLRRVPLLLLFTTLLLHQTRLSRARECRQSHIDADR